MASTNTARLRSLPEAAERLGLSVKCLRGWVLRRSIPYVKVGRAVRICNGLDVADPVVPWRPAFGVPSSICQPALSMHPARQSSARYNLNFIRTPWRPLRLSNPPSGFRKISKPTMFPSNMPDPRPWKVVTEDCRSVRR
jgi:excisionase family DNA binding protein